MYITAPEDQENTRQIKVKNVCTGINSTVKPLFTENNPHFIESSYLTILQQLTFVLSN
jgi:hypothetical protein